MSVSTDCASAIASRPHTMTSRSRAMVPTNLRARMDMMVLRRARFADARTCLYGPRHLRKASTHGRDSQGVKNRSAPRAALAVRRGGNDLFDPDRRRRDAVDGVGAVHRRMEADYGCAATAV